MASSIRTAMPTSCVEPELKEAVLNAAVNEQRSFASMIALITRDVRIGGEVQVLSALTLLNNREAAPASAIRP